jgi:serine/threonine-protein kinase
MALTIGTQLGSHEITGLLGKGGMGEVYRARDLKLKREVAIKMLPEEFSRDSDRVSRFQREAELLAALNHPNIAAIYDLQEANDTRFLVLELVEGETLAERIQRGPIPVEQALKIAHQIAEAFESAHEKGVIHRDLKPANVKITAEGKVKVLDFGLAKALESAPARVSSNSPTMLSAAATNGGMILGTAGYMSPEQARGHPADQRSDIFSFGCVLYEMLTGQQPFPGETVSDVLASILAREPDLRAALPHNLHPKIEELIRRCLAKHRKHRLHAIADVRVEIETIMSDPHGLEFQAVHGAGRRPLWKRPAPFVLSAALVVITAVIVWSLRPGPPLAAIAKFPLVLPEGQLATNTRSNLVAISPDGANIVYVANGQLYLRSLSDMEAKPIQGTAEDADSPFFSPDGRWLAFYAQTEKRLKKIAITGGASIPICDATTIFGASWDSEDHIFFGQQGKGILRVSANAGKPEVVVAQKPGEIAYGPQVLPGGDALLFTVSVSLNTLAWDRAKIVVQSLKTGVRKLLIEGGSDARFVPTGHIIYAVGSTLFAVPFDVKKLQTTGGYIPVMEGVRRSRLFPGGTTAATQFGFSNNGSMIYVPGGPVLGNGTDANLALVSRTGARKLLNIPPGPYSQPRISPNGKQLVLHTEYGEDRVVWIHDLTGATAPRKLTFGGHNHRPTWSPDGERVVYTSDRDGEAALFWQRADGNGPAEPLFKGETGVTIQSEAWSPHGNMIIFSTSRAAVRTLWTLSPGVDPKPKPLITTYSTNSSISPDGRWLAYTSSDSGGSEVYVQPFPPNGNKFQVTDGGRSPLWSPDGKQLFYLRAQGAGTSQIMAVDVQTQPNFVVVKTSPLPIERIVGDTGPRAYDIAPNGQSFIVMIPKSQSDPGKAPPDQINVTLNWFTELQQRVPVK